MKKVSIVIPVYINHNKSDAFKLTKVCIDSLMNSAGVDLEIIISDDASTMPNLERLFGKLYSNIIYTRNESNMGFASTANNGIAKATNNLVLLLNNDIIVHDPYAVKKMVDAMDKFDLTAPAGGRMDTKWNYIPGEATKPGDKFAYLVGWCLMVKADVFNKIGTIPTDFGKGYFEDVLFSYRARQAGLKLGITDLEFVNPLTNQAMKGIQHLYHWTFKNEGFDLSAEYQAKRQIFLRVIANDDKKV